MTVPEVLGGRVINEDLYTWITSGGFKVSAGFLIDQLTAVMLIVATTISSIVHIYSIGYMHGDGDYYRFSRTSAFLHSRCSCSSWQTISSTYFGWEAVGLCSYFLIGFWYEQKSASDAGKKAFIVNRFGDFGFGLGVILIFLTLGPLHYLPVFGSVNGLIGKSFYLFGYEFDLITVIALLLFCGAIGKSAQIPLHVWLPDAMEGPTPVSALIHAATMVTAGVFMVARCNPIFSLSGTAMTVVAVTGAVTALFAATIALVQNDIKRIVAYSTVSQLGYMFLALGVGAYGAGIFHLYTHAFFKALLFLGAGSVMHAMSGELDIQKMGGLKKHMPLTYWTFLIASLSIAGFPGLAGFFSQDEILWRAFSAGSLGRMLYVTATITALLTAFYSFRIIFVAFHGKFREPMSRSITFTNLKDHDYPVNHTCCGAIASGWVGIPPLLGGMFGIEHSDKFGEFLAPVVGHQRRGHSFRRDICYGSFHNHRSCRIFLCVYVPREDRPCKRIAEKYAPAYKVLWNKYYVDDFYDFIIVRPAFWIAGNVVLQSQTAR